MNIYSNISAINEWLCRALEGTGQIAFDWHIRDDVAHFSGDLAADINGAVLSATKTCRIKNLPAIIHAEDRETFREHLLKALKGAGYPDGTIHRMELRLADPRRQWRWVEISEKIVERNQDGRAVRMVGTLSDIDRRKQAEEKIVRLRGLYVALSQINKAIVRCGAPEQLFNEVCRIMVEHAGFDIAWIGIIDTETKQLVPAASYGDGAHPAHGPVVLTESSDGIRTYLQEGLFSMTSAPFRQGGQTAGSLNLYTRGRHALDDNLLSLLEEITRDISFALDSYARESKRRRTEALQLGENRILNMVATGIPLDDILAEITQFAMEQCCKTVCAIRLLGSDDSVLSSIDAPDPTPAQGSQSAGLQRGARSQPHHAAAHPCESADASRIGNDPLRKPGCVGAIAYDSNGYSSWPIFGKSRKLLGTLQLYYRQSAAPADDDARLAGICTSLAGIAIESRASEERIRYLAHYDGLTSLPNRFLFEEYLGLALRSAERYGRKFAVFFLDLDKFKDINDTLGHEAGDQVLREIAIRFRSTLRQTDKIARMGGDEFYILIEELNDARYAADVARKLLHEASRPVRVGMHDCQLSASIGIAIYPGDGMDENALLKNADKAMYRAKEMGKNTYRFFSTGTDRSTEEQLGLNRLSPGLVNN